MGFKILAINPGSTSTKVALFDNDTQQLDLTLRHTAEQIAAFPNVIDQLQWRKDMILKALAEQGAASTKVARYLEYLADAFGTAAPTLSAAATKTLDAYRWPRNYLQLREVSERLYILVGTGTVDRAVAEEVLAQEDVIKTATFGAPTLESDLYILRPLADTERDIAHLVVDHLHGNRTRAAEVLGISRTTLWRLLKDDDR